MFKVIVLAVDGSDASDRALAHAVDLAQNESTQLHILNVPQDETSALVMSGAGGYMPLMPPIQSDDLRVVGDQIVAKAKDHCIKSGLTNVSVHVQIGNAAHEVLALAEELHADLIVTGRRGLGGLASVVLGSTSHGILNGAKCATLSVP